MHHPHTTQGLPLLEHMDFPGRSALSRPPLTDNGKRLPEKCLLSFMNDALEDFVKRNGCRVVDVIHSETCDYPVYIHETEQGALCLVHVPVGAPAAAIVLDLLISSGVNTIMACGGCGVLNPIAAGKLILVTSALRDEGTSYFYAEPSRLISLDPHMIEIAKDTLSRAGIPFEEGLCWTCDAFFRETLELVDKRRKEGCICVDMECSALAAVAQFYGCSFGELLYSGDSLAISGKHEERGWLYDTDARSTCLQASIQTLLNS